MHISVPGPNARRMPPAALVTMRVSTPSAGEDAHWQRRHVRGVALVHVEAAALHEHRHATERHRRRARPCGRAPSGRETPGCSRYGIRTASFDLLGEPTEAAAQHDGDLGRPAAERRLHGVGGPRDRGHRRARAAHSRIPAMAADRKLASVPASMARKPSRARSALRLGASAPMPPIWMPTEEKLAKPASANDAMVNERGSSAGLHLARAARRR